MDLATSPAAAVTPPGAGLIPPPSTCAISDTAPTSKKPMGPAAQASQTLTGTLAPARAAITMTAATTSDAGKGGNTMASNSIPKARTAFSGRER